MAISNHERVRKSLELLNKGLLPFIERELKAAHGDKWMQTAQQTLGDIRHQQHQKEGVKWDTQAILSVMWDNWNTVFNKVLSQSERTLVSELKGIRNKWAHQEAFSTDDTYRAIDSCGRLLISVSAAEEAAEMERQKQEILRLRFDEQRKKEEQRAAVAPIEGKPMAGLRPWREVITPHPDVASGRYQQAEFAADLSQVYRGEGPDEYRDPREFFSRTFFTEGLKQLLTTALRRLNDNGGDPVVELHTNFGGGKTHSMLALYHMFSGVDFTDLPGMDSVLTLAGGLKPPKAKRAVLVGTALSPGHSTTKPDGTIVHTMWGELAWQLLGAEGYKLVADADKAGVSPGSDRLRELFVKAAPSVTLIDEWVVYVRQLYNKDGLPAGSFDASLSFAQSLTEAARAVPRTLLVASIPSSDIEIGGEAGKEVLSRLRNIFSRMESAWRPASAEESFEIVRRRLFQPVTDSNLFASRDAVCRAFADYYRNQKAEFPSACSEVAYERRLQAAYPIHPELFERLFNDWSTLDKFQRTRGVLRLMAAVISILWERNDSGLLIMPASIPMDASPVQTELTRYLEDSWVPVIEKDIDGPNSLPLELDKQNPNYGKYSACRRVARTLFLGSAATLKTAQKGLDDKRVKLGCFQPGETPATFGDALGRLADTATHLYVDGSRYWFSTQPSVMRVAEDRAVTQDSYDIDEEIKRRIRQDNKRGEFVGVHVPPNSADIPDEAGVKLIIFGPEHAHGKGDDESAARQLANDCLTKRGTAPRFCVNTLVFLVPDRTRLDELRSAARKYLAWKSVEKDVKELNLDVFQSNQVLAKVKSFDETVNLRIQETYTWILVPGQSKPAGDKSPAPVEWEEVRLQAGGDSLASRTWRKLKDQELVVKEYAGTLLRREMDSIPLWRGDHVTVKQLSEDYAKYLYLQRLRDTSVLLHSIKDGLLNTAWEIETFAYADGFDESTGRYLGLRSFDNVEPALNGNAVLVKSSVARKQIDADRAKEQESKLVAVEAAALSPSKTSSEQRVQPGSKTIIPSTGATASAMTPPKRFYGNVTIDATRLSRELGKISDEVISHLSGLVGAKVEITIEVNAIIPNGVPENVVRTVVENAKTLRFTSHDFESE
jgi:hypothetical protein